MFVDKGLKAIVLNTNAYQILDVFDEFRSFFDEFGEVGRERLLFIEVVTVILRG